MSRLANRVSVVTGGGSGIGRAVCLHLANEQAKVLVADVVDEAAEETARLILSGGGVATSAKCDVSDPDAVDALFDLVTDEFGVATALFNGAGIAIGKDALETTYDEWERTLAVNLRGVWLCSKTLISRLAESNQRGAIVNAASTNAFFAEPDLAAYSASKGAVLALTRAMAFDHAELGVRVNCVCPGIIETGLTTPWFDAQRDPAEARRQVGSAHALNRIGAPDEIAAVVTFLLSDDASFLTGAAVVADGGLTIGKKTL
jgi:NAD(P)-dependent dehydrogenase (short-subunit alcohol dehydrogenase family)